MLEKTPYAIWAAGFAGFTNNLPAQDHDGDTYVNLMEYAFGTNPTVNSAGTVAYSGNDITAHGQPYLDNVSGQWYMVFGRRKDYAAAGLTYTVQFSSSLATWTDNVVAPTTMATNDTVDGTMDVVRVPFPNTIPSPSGPIKPTMGRVQVSQP